MSGIATTWQRFLIPWCEILLAMRFLANVYYLVQWIQWSLRDNWGLWSKWLIQSFLQWWVMRIWTSTFRNDDHEGQNLLSLIMQKFYHCSSHWAAEVLCSGAFGSVDQLVCELAASKQASDTWSLERLVFLGLDFFAGFANHSRRKSN